MQNAWQRRRKPDDVPTPLAVAVSDFCRRTGVSASPAEVRDALSLLSEDEDFRVRMVTDSEPEARPLGPWAVIDVLRGTAQSLAATRHQSGYYELARVLVEAREAPAGGEVSQESAPPDERLPFTPVPTPEPLRRDKKAEAKTVDQRIAPKRRLASEVAPREVPALEPARTRELPRPKGRFTVVTAQRKSVDDLFRPTARELLDSWIQQYPDRFALTRALAEEYGGKKEGQVLRTEDLERALEHHKLFEPLQKKERDSIIGAYTEQRGATSRVAWALGLTVPELNRLIRALEIKDEVEQIRERYRREALSPKLLAFRLDLLGRGKYLSDLGIRKRFDDALRGDLRKLLQSSARQARGADDLLDVAARREGTQAELLKRAVEKLGLADELSNYAR